MIFRTIISCHSNHSHTRAASDLQKENNLIISHGKIFEMSTVSSGITTGILKSGIIIKTVIQYLLFNLDKAALALAKNIFLWFPYFVHKIL